MNISICYNPLQLANILGDALNHVLNVSTDRHVLKLGINAVLNAIEVALDTDLHYYCASQHG
jgi:hypothetical protein